MVAKVDPNVLFNVNTPVSVPCIKYDPRTNQGVSCRTNQNIILIPYLYVFIISFFLRITNLFINFFATKKPSALGFLLNWLP